MLKDHLVCSPLGGRSQAYMRDHVSSYRSAYVPVHSGDPHLYVELEGSYAFAIDLSYTVPINLRLF